MKVAILGGSGFIGSQLTKHLVHKGHQVIIGLVILKKLNRKIQRLK